MPARIIGLIGAPGAGKDDVVARRLVEKYGFKRLAFADRIKDCYYKEIGITDEHFKKCRGTKEEARIRKGLWKYSDKMRKIYGDGYFMNPVIKKATENERTVISDIRTQSELHNTIAESAQIVVVTRGKIKCAHYDNFPETRIPYRWIRSFLRGAPHVFSEFKNNFATLSEAYKEFDKFYELIGGTNGS
jgi:hypothetical protein